jgi:hypothetical protein
MFPQIDTHVTYSRPYRVINLFCVRVCFVSLDHMYIMGVWPNFSEYCDGVIGIVKDTNRKRKHQTIDVKRETLVKTFEIKFKTQELKIKTSYIIKM